MQKLIDKLLHARMHTLNCWNDESGYAIADTETVPERPVEIGRVKAF